MILFFLMIIFVSTETWAAQPIQVLRGGIDQILNILSEPEPKQNDQSRIQKEKLGAVIEKTFDFREMASRSLARHWNRFTDSQKKEFTSLFSRLLGNTYIERIRRGYKDEKVEYLGQEMVGDSKAFVKTKVFGEGLEIPVNYSMLKRNGIWVVYDVNIEGVSMVKNYRSQFGGILLKSPPAKLINMLKDKIKQMEKDVKGQSTRYIHRMTVLAQVYGFVLPQSMKSDLNARLHQL